MTITDAAIQDFVAFHSGESNKEGRPNWIVVTLTNENQLSRTFTFDFKNDVARKAFGALCHWLYTSSEVWEITTKRVK